MVSVVEDPMAGFLYALRSPSRRNIHRGFLRFLGFNGEFKNEALEFLKKSREDPEWAEDMLMRFSLTGVSKLLELKMEYQIYPVYPIEPCDHRTVQWYIHLPPPL